MQMPGGHLLAAGLDGGNTMIKSIPTPALQINTPSGCFLFGIEKMTGIEPIQEHHLSNRRSVHYG
jgi:hypothetical protein